MTIEEVVKFCSKNSIRLLNKQVINNIVKNLDGSFDFNCDIFVYKNVDFPFKINKVDGNFCVLGNKEFSCKNLPRETIREINIFGKIVDLNDWNVEKVGESIAIYSNIEFEDLDFLYNTKFEKLWITSIDSPTMEKYKPYFKSAYLSFEEFENMKDDGIIKDKLKELDEYIMEI